MVHVFFHGFFPKKTQKKNDGSGDRTGLLMVQLNNHMLNHHVCEKRSLPEVFKWYEFCPKKNRYLFMGHEISSLVSMWAIPFISQLRSIY